MDKLIIWEDKITLGGVELSDSTISEIKTLSLIMRVDTKTMCDRLNALLQTFSGAWDTLKNLAKEILEVLAVEKEDICESCIGSRTRHGRRTRHGSSIKAGKPRQAKENIKWQEKYRPP